MEARLFTGLPAEWDEFVERQAAATASHCYAWKRVIEEAYQHDCPYLAAYEGDTLRAVLPLVDVRSLTFGRYLVSMPFLSGGGPLGDASAFPALGRAAIELARSGGARHLELRCTRPLQVELEASTEKITCVLPLGDAASVWSAFPGKLRSQIRRPQKAGVEMRFGADQLRPFFRVFERNMRDLGSPTHRFSFFRAVVERLGAQAEIGCAYYRGVPIAAGFGLRYGNELEMTWASSLREHSSIAANMLLYWSFIERAAQAGLARFNFGRCTPGTGSHRFKQQWGALDEPLYWYRMALRANAGPPRKEDGALSLAMRLWQRVPVPLATALGGRLRGGIPS